MDKFAKILNQLAGVPKKDQDYMETETGETIEEKNRVLSARDADLAQNPESSTPEETLAKEEYMSKLMDMAGFGMMGMAKAAKPVGNTLLYGRKGPVKDIPGEFSLPQKPTPKIYENSGRVSLQGGVGVAKTASLDPKVLEIASGGKNVVVNEPTAQAIIAEARKDDATKQKMRELFKNNKEVTPESLNNLQNASDAKQSQVNEIRRKFGQIR